MAKFFISYFTTALVFCALDFVWLAVVVKDFYAREIGPLLLASPRKEAAIAFYLLYLIGVVIFAVLPAIDADRWQKALGYGALLGLIAYATYDLSNLATLKGWSVQLAIVDMAWGTIATAIAATAGFWLTKFVGSRFL
jgi:uncharacterized membrane protein